MRPKLVEQDVELTLQSHLDIARQCVAPFLKEHPGDAA